MQKITSFICNAHPTDTAYTRQALEATGQVKRIVEIECLYSSEAIMLMASEADTEFTLVYIQPHALRPGMYALERMMQVADDTGADWVYADRYLTDADGTRKEAPVIDYQQGSLRDDFDFGSLLLLRTTALKEAARRITASYQYAGLYDLRLKMSLRGADKLVHINEYLYTEVETDHRRSGEKLFDYVDPRNRHRQIEMEQACTDHLKEIGAYLSERTATVDFNQYPFEQEASVIIPVRNRIRTIADAISSVLSQEADFRFNLIVVDNHSTDGTTEVIDRFADDPRVIHLIPERTDLSIGGCWNYGIHHPACGKFAIQLDSDDVYSSNHTLTTMVSAFYRQNCAMVVGTYLMTDFEMHEIAPGIIDHREWTPQNGHNNALRINGLGAPRAFFTPLLREMNLPNTGYGEDYAAGLRISRQYRIGRVYDVVYLCRRWEDNSDAAIDIVKMNAHNLYKDRLRTWEVMARIAQNRSNQ